MSEASAAEYKPLTSDELDSSEVYNEHHPRSPPRRWMLYAQVTCAVLLALTLGVFIGRFSLTATSHNKGLLRCKILPLDFQTHTYLLTQRSGGDPAPPGEIHQVWQHNLTFSQSPTLESESAWAATVPVGRGFIHHPELAPFISGIAVFHQLHCLVRTLSFSTSPFCTFLPPKAFLSPSVAGSLVFSQPSTPFWSPTTSLARITKPSLMALSPLSPNSSAPASRLVISATALINSGEASCVLATQIWRWCRTITTRRMDGDRTRSVGIMERSLSSRRDGQTRATLGL